MKTLDKFIISMVISAFALSVVNLMKYGFNISTFLGMCADVYIVLDVLFKNEN